MRCFFGFHEVARREKRDVTGRVVKPHVIEWHCVLCLKVLGETTLKPSWSLLSRIRRQRTPSQIPMRRRA